jgi:hypothetical protein
MPHKNVFTVLLFVIILLPNVILSIPTIDPSKSSVQELITHGFRPPFKLHLGCGEAHFAGYINIDYPPSEHTVQTRTGSDIYADILKLSFSENSISEFRSHHFFEHFNRQQALALLCTWHYALEEGGILFIETPDFEQSIKMLLENQYSYQDKQVIIRHIFGSHEAFWALHYDGWYDAKYRYVLGHLGFEVISSQKSSYRLTHNITIKARKNCSLSVAELKARASNLLRDYLVNTTPDEEKMWGVWCQELKAQFDRGIIQ